MKRLIVFGLALSFLLLGTSGCELFFPESSEADHEALMEEYGGYTTDSEAPAFGDEDLLATVGGDSPFDDEMSTHPTVTNARHNGRAKVYALRMIWGNLPDPADSVAGEPEECPVTDWSGSVVVDGGVVIVRAIIKFEPGDFIVRPRISPRELRWVSHTKGHVDGIVLEIIDVPEPESVSAANVVKITTPLYSVEIPLDELEEYSDYQEYDECNSISLFATRISFAGCPRGFLGGKWIAETDTSGIFKGGWISYNGRLVGYLRGHYTKRDGRRVFFGKWITRSGAFGGLLKGTWEPMDGTDCCGGTFEGYWVDETYTRRGVLKGHYCTACDSVGFFHGRWLEFCR